MKKTTILLLSIAVLISFTQCSNPAPENLCKKAGTHGKIVSELMNNDAYMNKVMDSMWTKHPDVILFTVFVMAKSDKEVAFPHKINNSN